MFNTIKIAAEKLVIKNGTDFNVDGSASGGLLDGGCAVTRGIPNFA